MFLFLFASVVIVLLRFISMGFLMSAMIRIKSLIETDLTQMPNTRIMISFIVVFVLFALSSVGEGIIIFMTELDPPSNMNGSKVF